MIDLWQIRTYSSFHSSPERYCGVEHRWKKVGKGREFSVCLQKTAEMRHPNSEQILQLSALILPSAGSRVLKVMGQEHVSCRYQSLFK